MTTTLLQHLVGSITLGALPDVDTEIIISWGEHLSVDIQDGVLAPAIPTVKFAVTDPAADGDGRSVLPNSLTINWTTGGSSYSLTDDGAGNLYFQK